MVLIRFRASAFKEKMIDWLDMCVACTPMSRIITPIIRPAILCDEKINTIKDTKTSRRVKKESLNGSILSLNLPISPAAMAPKAPTKPNKPAASLPMLKFSFNKNTIVVQNALKQAKQSAPRKEANRNFGSFLKRSISDPISFL